MQSNSINIAPGATINLNCAGRFFSYESGTSSSADVYIIVKGDGINEMRLKPGQTLVAETAASIWQIKGDDKNATITGNIIIGNGDFRDSAINATIAGQVIVTSGNVTSTSTNVNTNAQAIPVQKQALSNLTDFPVVNVGTAPALMFSDATQRILRIRNSSATANVYIGGTSVAIGQAAIVLHPGDMWTEEEAAGAVWWAVADSAGATVNIQGVK